MAALKAVCDDGVRLHADHYGAGNDARAVVCLPGLTRNARDFSHLARVLAGNDDPASVIVMEYRGRGRSDYAAPETYTLSQELADLIAALDQWAVPEADIVGTSRGGLLAMLLATTAPERVGRIVLNDIGPTIEAAGLSRIAGEVGRQMTYPSFEALAERLKAAHGAQFPTLDRAGWRDFAEQLASADGDGTVTLDYDPALATMFESFSADDGAVDFWPAFDPLVDRPVMVLRGARSDILSAATVEGMRRRHPALKAVVIPEEGHAPLLWDRFSTEAIRTFLHR